MLYYDVVTGARLQRLFDGETMLGLVLTMIGLAPLDALTDKIAAVLPVAEEERWLQIPWNLNLMQARTYASESKRPLFLWIMNGHPMGCT